MVEIVLEPVGVGDTDPVGLWRDTVFERDNVGELDGVKVDDLLFVVDLVRPVVFDKLLDAVSDAVFVNDANVLELVTVADDVAPLFDIDVEGVWLIDVEFE